MPYATGSATSATGLISALSAFLVGQLGWTLIDDISASDKVFYSTGITGDRNIYVRLRAGYKDRNVVPDIGYWQNQEFTGAQFDHVNVETMQHWNTSTHTGTNHVSGRIGPWGFVLFGNNYRNGNGSARHREWIEETRSAVFLPNRAGETTGITQDWISSFTGFWAYGPNARYVPGRGPYLLSTTAATDYRESKKTNLLRRAWGQETSSFPSTNIRFTLASDTSGKIVMYCLGGTSTSDWTSGGFASVDMDTGVRTYLATPPPGGVTYGNGEMAWDGGDYIYMRRNSINEMFRYTISTNTWTTLTGPGTTGNLSWGMSWMNYIHASSSLGVAMSWSSDRIYCKENSTGTPRIHYYNVSTDSWTSVVTGDNGAVDSSDGGFCVWDGGTKLHIGGAKQFKHRVYDIQAGTWLNKDDMRVPPDVSDPYAAHMFFLDCHQNQIPVDKTATTYHFFGDENHFKVVTKDNTSKYWFYYAGEIDSYYSTQVVKLSSSVTAGTNVVIPVTGLFDQFEVGQPLYIYDHVSGGKAEAFTPTAFGTGTITGTLVNSYSSDAYIGVDPQSTVISTNFWDAVQVTHAAQGPGAFGNNSNPNTYKQNVSYSLIPANKLMLNATFRGKRNHFQMFPVTVASVPSTTPEPGKYNFMYTPTTGAAQGSRDNMIGKMLELSGNVSTEARGNLIGVYATKKTTGPDPISEDEIDVGGERYKLFKCENIFNSFNDDLSILVGPI